jgi:hypothetical protein
VLPLSTRLVVVALVSGLSGTRWFGLVSKRLPSRATEDGQRVKERMGRIWGRTGAFSAGRGSLFAFGSQDGLELFYSRCCGIKERKGGQGVCERISDLLSV